MTRITCPINGDNHKYFIFKTSTEFIPVEDEDFPAGIRERYGQLFRKVEYAILGCNCSDVIKTEVKNAAA